MSLPFETATQFAALAITLVAGLLIGIGVAPGGKRWRERYRDEEVAHRATRERANAEIGDANRRIRELEAEQGRLRSSAAVAPTAAAAAVAADHGSPSTWRGWFGWGRDNLSRIRGVDATIEARLNDLGVKTYREIETMSPEEEAALEARLDLRAGTIADQGWREQAALLRAGNDDEHGRRFV